MSIIAAELLALQSANHAEDDVSTQGGAISATGKVEFTQLAANDDIEAVSSNAGDTMNLTITARSVAGAIVSELKALNGTTAVIFSTIGVVERFLKALLASAAAGTITIRRSVGGATIATLEPGLLRTRIFFYDSASGASQKILFEKFFFKNTNGTLTLTSATLKLTADPAAVIRIGGAPSVDDSATISNRLAVPASVTFVDDNVSQNLPSSALAAGSAIGVWVEMTLAANNAPIRNTFSSQLAGTTV